MCYSFWQEDKTLPNEANPTLVGHHHGHGHDHEHPVPEVPGMAGEGETMASEADIAGNGLWTRIKLKAVETAPWLGRFIEVQAACSCASGCPTCVGATAASIALPIVTRGRRSSSEETTPPPAET